MSASLIFMDLCKCQLAKTTLKLWSLKCGHILMFGNVCYRYPSTIYMLKLPLFWAILHTARMSFSETFIILGDGFANRSSEVRKIRDFFLFYEKRSKWAKVETVI